MWVQEAVELGLIDEIGGLSDALHCLYRMMEEGTAPPAPGRNPIADGAARGIVQGRLRSPDMEKTHPPPPRLPPPGGGNWAAVGRVYII